MGVLDPNTTLPPLKSFSLTHILYDPTHPLSIPLSLLSLSPIFLFVSYTTILLFTRRFTVLLLLLGQLANEIFNLLLKRVWKGERPFFGQGEVGDGYGMPSSHSQFAGFLVVWGLGFWSSLERRYGGGKGGKVMGGGREVVARWRGRVYILGLGIWSVLVAYSRYHLHYHSSYQIITGYIIGCLTGLPYYIITEHIPLYHPNTIVGRVRREAERLWEGIGGVGGFELGGAGGGWGEGWLLLDKGEGKGRVNGNGSGHGKERRKIG